MRSIGLRQWLILPGVGQFMRYNTIPFVLRFRLPLCILLVISGIGVDTPFLLNRRSISLRTVAQTAGEDTKAAQLLEVGDRQYNSAQFREALTTYQQALAVYQAVNSHVGKGDTFMRLGLAYYRLSQYQRALDALQQALKAQEDVRDRAAKVARRMLTKQRSCTAAIAFGECLIALG